MKLKTEVDLQQLAQAVSAAILQFAVTQTSEPPRGSDVAITIADDAQKEIVRKKRGRPKKEKVEAPPVEEKEEAVDNSFTVSSRRKDFKPPEGEKRYAKKVKFKKKNRVNQFVDNLELAKAAMYNEKGEKLKYPEHSPPRPKQQKQTYKCENCNKNFEAFPSYIPPKGEGGHQPQIRCYNCNCR